MLHHGAAPSDSTQEQVPSTSEAWFVDEASPAGIASELLIVSSPDSLLAPRQADGNSSHASPVDREDLWPHTRRPLPWLLAGFLVMIWLIPFYSIRTPIPIGVDGKLDRLYLPLVVGMWIFVICTKGRAGPKLRWTAIHCGLFAFSVVAVISVLLNVPMLDRLGELGMAVKQIFLLLSYITLFVVVASSVRRGEVRNFIRLSIVLASLCAIGTIYEYRSYHNLFYQWTQKLLPPGFKLTDFPTSGFDSSGRRVVEGPTQHGLELATILAMVLPFVVLAALKARKRGHRLLYGLVAALLLAAMVATFRKTAVIAPIAGVLVLCAYRPRIIVKLLPAAVVMIGMVHVTTPGATGSVLAQLNPSSFGSVSTTQHRTFAFDAVRPDVFKRPIFGRGYGTYDPHKYRYLDDEWLMQLINTGYFGVWAYGLVILSVIALAHRWVRQKISTSDLGLAAVAAAVVYAVANLTFDALSFPHVPYLFLFLAGLVAVGARDARAMRTGMAAMAPEAAA